VLILLLLRALHPPAGATTLLVALGALQTKTDALNVIIGVLIIAAAGEMLRLIRLGKMRPSKS
jgi:CBS-domain-containing membrane protein